MAADLRPHVERETQIQPPSPSVPPTPSMPLMSAIPGSSLPVMTVNPRYLNSPDTILATLPPDELLQELLGRIMTGGVGRLYFERQADRGRILWSESGVLKSVLEDLPLATLTGVIRELKTLTRLPLELVQQVIHVEIERLYQNNRILLRLRLAPKHGAEEATLQILRGAALKFYQQQQLTNLGRDTLNVAQVLRGKVNELNERTRSAPQETLAAAAPELNEVIRGVEAELARLKQCQSNWKPNA
jgi:hypothetical protein